LLLAKKLLNQVVKLKSLLRTFFDMNDYMVNRYGMSVLQITADMVHLS